MEIIVGTAQKIKPEFSLDWFPYFCCWKQNKTGKNPKQIPQSYDNPKKQLPATLVGLSYSLGARVSRDSRKSSSSKQGLGFLWGKSQTGTTNLNLTVIKPSAVFVLWTAAELGGIIRVMVSGSSCVSLQNKESSERFCSIIHFSPPLLLWRIIKDYSMDWDCDSDTSEHQHFSTECVKSSQDFAESAISIVLASSPGAARCSGVDRLYQVPLVVLPENFK